MTPDEVIEKLEQLNIKITRRTLLNYEKQGFIEEAKRGGKGRGRGRTTEYADNVWIDVYAIYGLIHDGKISLEYLRTAIPIIRQATRSNPELGLVKNKAYHYTTTIDIALLYLKYMYVARAHVPYGGKIIQIRISDKDAMLESFIVTDSFSGNSGKFLREHVLKCIEDNKPILGVGDKKNDAVVLISQDVHVVVLLWDNENNRWETRKI